MFMTFLLGNVSQGDHVCSSWKKKLHFQKPYRQSDRIKASVNNEANQKISGDSHRSIVTRGKVRERE